MSGSVVGLSGSVAVVADAESAERAESDMRRPG